MRLCTGAERGSSKRGSGVSTVVLARLLRQRGGGATIVAVEHDAQ
jgi:hypothetical protein